jgi:hypothetical protein
MEKDSEDISVDPESPIKKGQQRKHLSNSVKDVLILALVPDVPENYQNLKVLWQQTKLNEVKMTLSCDHKVANLVLGIQESILFFLNIIVAVWQPQGVASTRVFESVFPSAIEPLHLQGRNRSNHVHFCAKNGRSGNSPEHVCTLSYKDYV